MTAWWNTRSDREKLLLGIAAFFLAAALIWQLVLRPAIYTLEQSRLNHEKSSQTLARLDRIESLIQQGERITPAVAAPTTQDTASLQAQAAQMAQQAGLSVELPTSGARAFQVKVSAASGPAFFQWIESVETGLGISVNTASLAQNADGTMDATTEFSLDKKS